jgi:signal transduction histidine kinase
LLIEEKHLHLSVETNEFMYDTDKNMLQNVLSNLVSNAVRYTEADGEIRIVLHTKGIGAVLSIENQCAVIAEHEIERLFEPFYSLSYSRDKRKSGAGLGLYITKKILERLQIDYKMEKTLLGLRFNLNFDEGTVHQ